MRRRGEKTFLAVGVVVAVLFGGCGDDGGVGVVSVMGGPGVGGGVGGVGGPGGGDSAGAGGTTDPTGAGGVAASTGVAGEMGVAGAAGAIGGAGTTGAAGAVGGAGTTGAAGAVGGAGTTGTAGGGPPPGGAPGGGDPNGLIGFTGWPPIGSPTLTVHGGDSSTGAATPGGVIQIASAGGIRLLPAGSVAVPAPASDVTVLDAAMLAADVSVPGSVRVAGDVTSGGTDAVRHITAGGDIFVTGALRSAALGGPRQGLALSAGGSVYVTGTIDIAGAASQTGDAGSAGTLAIDAEGTVQIAGVVDARGGLVLAGAAGGARGGVAGAIWIGVTTRPVAVEIAADLIATGGSGPTRGGAGGSITLAPRKGNLELASWLDASGGASAVTVDVGGVVAASVGEGVGSNQVDGGDIILSGRISAGGGGIVVGGSGNSGMGGAVILEARSYLGALTITAAGRIEVDGGRAHGATVAGGGGHVSLFVQNGDLTIAGHLSGRGGVADDAAGHGGLGGQFNIFSDNNFDGYGGNLLLDTTGVIDASGGDGARGGDARNDGRVGIVASFPDDRELIAVLFNCDGVHGSSHNWLQNLGWIVARGGAHDGAGGDVAYHGITPDRNAKPPSGNIDLSADGSGVAGDFRGE